jgi:hypothetical protein
MIFTRIKQIVLKTGGILLLGSILFQFEQIPLNGILYGSEPLPSTVAPFRYKIPLPSPPKELSPAATTDVQSQPEQQAVSTRNSLPFDSPILAQPTSAANHSVDKAEPPKSGTGDKQKGEKDPVIAASKTGTKAASKSGAGSRLRSEPLSPKASVVSGSSKKILEIESDLTSPSAEMITIVLTGLFPPEAQVIEGKTPKIICDFPDVLMEKSIKRMIPINGKYVLQVRTGIHPPPEPKTRVVIDLAPNHDYEVEQLFYEKNNRYSMIIREKP